MTNNPRYFGGDGSSMGQVHTLSCATFDEFVREILGHPHLLNLTREQYHALPEAEQRARKRVAYVTPATFKTAPISKRVHTEASGCVLIALDIDDPVQARPFVAKPDLLHTALAPYAFAAYTTASSTPAKPKLRIMVACDIPLDEYQRAVKYIAARLGLPTITKESLVPVQPMYLPTLFAGEDPIVDHPLVMAVSGDTVLPKDLTDSSVETERTVPKRLDGDISDDLEFLRTTLDNVTLDDCAKALDTLDPDCTYPEWLEIAAALRHQFVKTPQPAYELFDQWSAKGKKYVSSADTKAKWDSLRPTPRGRRPVTARTLFAKAQDAGWNPATVANKLYNGVMEWLSDDTRTGDELMSAGIAKIAGLPLVSSVARSTLLSRLREALAKHKLRVSVTDLKRSLSALERAAQKPQTVKSTPDAQLPPWARGICYVAGANEFFQRNSNRKFGPEVADNLYGVHLTTADSLSGRPAMRPRDFLLNVAKIPRVDYYHYDPAHPEQTFVEAGKQKYVNLYLPTYPEPDPDDADYAGLILTEHLVNLIAEPAYRATLLDFLAFLVQHPGEKIRWAVLLQGAQGCGKTALVEVMRAVLGQTNVSIIDASLLFSQFNPWATGSQLVAMEEIRVVGHNRHDVMNKLKPCISNDTVTVRNLYAPPIQVPNNSNYFMLTNHHDSLALSDGDRRYFVLNSALQNLAQVAALGPKYFPRLFDCIHGHGSGLRAFLERHEISKDFPADGHAPVTRYMRDLQTAAATPLSAGILEALADGEHPLVQLDFVSSKALKAVLELENLPRFNDQMLATALRELDYIPLGRFRLDDGKQNLWAKRGVVVKDPLKMAADRLAIGVELL